MKGFILGLFLFSASSIMAADGSSGCGPGWFIAKDNSLLSSALRATTNGLLFPLVSFGMTSGTSNCTKHSIVKTEEKSLYFVTQNLYEIKTEAAKGNGEFLQALGSTIGCKAGHLEYFSEKMQSNFEVIFKAQATNEEVLLETYKVILTDPTLVQSCSLS